VLRAQLEAPVDVPDVELHGRLLVPAGVLAGEEVSEEPLLQRDAVVGLELGEVLKAVDFQPLVFRGDAGVALEVAAGVEVMPQLAADSTGTVIFSSSAERSR
jgi:hypothetical protein